MIITGYVNPDGSREGDWVAMTSKQILSKTHRGFSGGAIKSRPPAMPPQPAAGDRWGIGGDPAALEGNEGWFDDEPAAGEPAALDVERLIRAVINTKFTWTDHRARFIAESLAAEYARLSEPTDDQ